MAVDRNRSFYYQRTLLLLCDRTAVWPLYDRSMALKWPLYNCSLTALWPFNDRFITVLWPLYDRSMTALWPLDWLTCYWCMCSTPDSLCWLCSPPRTSCSGRRGRGNSRYPPDTSLNQSINRSGEFPQTLGGPLTHILYSRLGGKTKQ